MSNIICKIPYRGTDYYLLWSTIVDAPVTYGMTLEEFNKYMLYTEGSNYMKTIHPERMIRVEGNGTSYHNYSLEELIRGNRAGPKEKCLDLESIIRDYIEYPKEVDYY